MGDPSDEAPGWDAIDGALASLYDGVEPQHYGPVVSRQQGGDDPIEGISVYVREEPTPHFHFVTYGFTELWDKESDEPEISGFGFELTFRLAREPDEVEPPGWALHFLQNLGRYVFRTSNAFASGHKMGLNGPIAAGERTAITAVCFTDDPELGTFTSPNGSAEFLQVVGITDDEYRLIQDWCTDGLLSLLATRSELLVTELWRPSILARPGVLEALQERIDREGSSETSSFAADLAYDSDGSRVVMTLGALYAPAISRAMLGRIRHHRSYQLMGRTQAVVFEPGEAAWRIVDGRLVLGVPPMTARSIAAQVGGRAGRYDLAIPGVTLVVAPTYIRDQAGRVVDVKGVAPDEVEEFVAAENAKLAAPVSQLADGVGRRSKSNSAAKPAAAKPAAKPATKAATSAGAKPAATKAAATKPAAKAKPAATKPAAAKAAAKAKPAATKPAAAKAAAKAKPAATKPAATKPAAKAAPKPAVKAKPAASKPKAKAAAKQPAAKPTSRKSR